MSRHTRPGPHFEWSEFDSHDGRQVPMDLETGIRFLIKVWLTPMREEFGAIKVVSGYRSRVHNAEVGGSPHSVHLGATPLPHRGPTSKLMAAAADVVPARGSVSEWAVWAGHHRQVNGHLAAAGRGGIGVYHDLGFVHLDTGGLRNWTGSTDVLAH